MNTHVVGMSMADTEHGEVWMDAETNEWTPSLFQATSMSGNDAALMVERLKRQGVKAYSEPRMTAAQRVLEVEGGGE